MPEESAHTLRPEGAGSEGTPHDEALAEAFAASLADPAAQASTEDPSPTTGGEMPMILLIQAGLTAFNAVIILIYLAFWMIDITVIASALRAGAGFAFLLSLAPTLLGAFLVRRYTKRKIKPPGAIWAHAGVYVGVAMCTLTLVIPMVVTLRSIFAGP